MFARYVVTLVALEEDLKSKMLVMNSVPRVEEVELMLSVIFPDAIKTHWTVNIFNVDVEPHYN